MDIAALGFSIDSRPLSEAAGWLEKTAIHATRADNAVAGFVASMRSLGSGAPHAAAEARAIGGDAAQAARSRAELRTSQGSLEAFNATVEVGGALMSRLDGAINALAGTSSRTFGQIAADFAVMLARMETRAAASNLWNLLSGNGGPTHQGILGGLLGSILGALGGPTNILAGSPINPHTGFMMGFASGGDPPPGVPYIVGENGPEIRVDRTPGRIIPLDRWGEQRGGSPSVSVSIVNNGQPLESGRRQTQTATGWEIEIMVDAVEARLANRMARDSGALARVQRSRYGAGAPRK